MIKSAILALFLLSSSAYAVVGGESMPQDKDIQQLQRATVRIVERSSNGMYQQFCTGTATGPNEVVTASHCLVAKGRLGKMIHGVLFAEIREPITGKLIKRIQVKSGRGDWSQARDLAVLKLGEDVPGGTSIPLAVAKCEGKERIVAGWGLDQHGDDPGASKIARYVEVGAEERERVLKDSDGEFIKFFPDDPTIAVHRRENGNICHGDSGGPVYCKIGKKWALASVVGDMKSPSTMVSEETLDAFAESKGSRSDLARATTCPMQPYMIGPRISESVDSLRRWQEELDPPSARVPMAGAGNSRR